MDYKKEDEDLNYLNKKKYKYSSYKTIIIAGIIIVVIILLGLLNGF